MELIHDPRAFQQQALGWRGEGLMVALVPTMGALHEGHLRLIDEARRLAGSRGRVAVSIFVNPIQFNSPADFTRYPRTLEVDAEACLQHGVDLVFAPEAGSMYLPTHRTHVEVEKLTDPLCGAWRPGHFRGVTTVVAKLFLLALPTHALFGWKDAQQFLVLRRMVLDLNMPIEMIGVETVREADGLAMSSRNAYLSDVERADAPLIYRGLAAARAAFDSGERRAEALVGRVAESLATSPLLKPEYIELRSMETLELQAEAEAGNSLLAVACHLGVARLIDNLRF